MIDTLETQSASSGGLFTREKLLTEALETENPMERPRGRRPGRVPAPTDRGADLFEKQPETRLLTMRKGNAENGEFLRLLTNEGMTRDAYAIKNIPAERSESEPKGRLEADLMKKVLITGANGQIGSELIFELRKRLGADSVVGLDLREPGEEQQKAGPYEVLDATDKAGLEKIMAKYQIDTIFHLVGILSATGEKNPNLAWKVNMTSLLNVLEIARETKAKNQDIHIFWPSSIAAFGPTTPREHTPQETVMVPTTMYGVTKVAGELLCQYYYLKYGVDVRSIRYPGLISWKTAPGGGTTDYAVAIFYEAVQNGKYECYLEPGTVLPMMYMPDAIRGTIELMDAPAENIKTRTSYNFSAVSFSCAELAAEVKKLVPGFECAYNPDSRQKIANSWPKTIDDSVARAEWGWKHEFDTRKMATDMMANLKHKFGRPVAGQKAAASEQQAHPTKRKI